MKRDPRAMKQAELIRASMIGAFDLPGLAHELALQGILALMTFDASNDSPEGRLLVRLAKAVDVYEKETIDL